MASRAAHTISLACARSLWRSSSVAARDDVHQLVHFAPLLGLVAGCNRVLNAMRGMIGEDLFLGAPQRGPYRRELGNDVDAIAIVPDHARQPAHLALDPPQPFEHRSLGVCPHAPYIPLRGMWFKAL